MSEQATRTTEAQRIKDELKHPDAEPLLPVEKKLIAWSLGTGIVLLLVLVVVTRLLPAGLH
ncbi:MAG: hypothetical protein QM586_03690 [Xenophilus sp.]